MYGLQGREITMTTKTLKRRDDNVRDHVLFELKSDPRITSSDIAAAVTLSGFVTSYWEKDAAEKAAKRSKLGKGLAKISKAITAT
jgi:osmotically-inducible protein OsmY